MGKTPCPAHSTKQKEHTQMKPNTNTQAEAIGMLYPAIWKLMDIGMSADAILCEVISAIRMQNNGQPIIPAVALKKLGVTGGRGVSFKPPVRSAVIGDVHALRHVSLTFGVIPLIELDWSIGSRNQSRSRAK